MISGLLADIRKRVLLTAIKMRQRRSQVVPLSSADCWHSVQRCLVLWPGDTVGEAGARLVIERLRTRFPGIAVTVLYLAENSSLPGDLYDRAIQMEKEQLNLFGLPVRSLREELMTLGVEVAVDLSPAFSPLAGYLCLTSRARLRVGFAGPFSDYVYNFQVAPRLGRRGIERYRVLARYLGW